jgi:hypothetical protein
MSRYAFSHGRQTKPSHLARAIGSTLLHAGGEPHQVLCARQAACARAIERGMLCRLTASPAHPASTPRDPYEWEPDIRIYREFCITKHCAPQLYEKYELHIYTMGTRAYARTVARILDESGKLFGDRILSRDDGFDQVRGRPTSRQRTLLEKRTSLEGCPGVVMTRGA